MDKKFPYLTNIKPKTSIFNRRKTAYLQAFSKDKEKTLLWIEEDYFGKRLAYPCVYKNKNEISVFIYGADDLNEEIYAFWDTLTPEVIEKEYDVELLPKKDFFKLFSSYQEQSIDK